MNTKLVFLQVTNRNLDLWRLPDLTNPQPRWRRLGYDCWTDIRDYQAMPIHWRSGRARNFQFEETIGDTESLLFATLEHW